MYYPPSMSLDSFIRKIKHLQNKDKIRENIFTWKQSSGSIWKEGIIQNAGCLIIRCQLQMASETHCKLYICSWLFDRKLYSKKCWHKRAKIYERIICFIIPKTVWSVIINIIHIVTCNHFLQGQVDVKQLYIIRFNREIAKKVVMHVSILYVYFNKQKRCPSNVYFTIWFVLEKAINI